MTQPFGHEKLIVYQKAMRFATLRGALLHDLARRVAACDHLDRAAESILVNIAHASNTWSPKERIVYLGHATEWRSNSLPGLIPDGAGVDVAPSTAFSTSVSYDGTHQRIASQ